MAVDLDALVALQQRRTKRAMEGLASADAALRAAERAMQAQISRCQENEASHASRREERIRSILREPASVISLSRVRLQYEVGEEERAMLAAELLTLRQEVQAAATRVSDAKTIVDTCLKREKKLEAGSAHVARGRGRLEDVKAEMDLER